MELRFEGSLGRSQLQSARHGGGTPEAARVRREDVLALRDWTFGGSRARVRPEFPREVTGRLVSKCERWTFFYLTG